MSQGEADDRAAIERCVRDYFEAWYAGDASRMRAVLHPELAKRGYVDQGAGLALARETSDSMADFTQLGIGTRIPAEKRGVDIRIDDVHGNIAAVTASSAVYREYVHLVRTADGWRILNTLWEPAGG